MQQKSTCPKMYVPCVLMGRSPAGYKNIKTKQTKNASRQTDRQTDRQTEGEREIKNERKKQGTENAYNINQKQTKN